MKAPLSPTRKRIAILIVVVGSVLIGERVMSLAMAEDDEVVAAAVRPSARPTRSDAGGSGNSGNPNIADKTELRLRTERLDAREQALAAAAARARAPQPKANLNPNPNPFDSVSWRPPAPPAPPAPPPPKPKAPPFPYTYVGGMFDADVRTAFFEKSDRVVALKAGDTVDGVFRVDQMTDKQMQLTYLPLEQRVTVPLGGPP